MKEDIMENVINILSFLYVGDDSLIVDTNTVVNQDCYTIYATMKKPESLVCPGCGSTNCRSKGQVNQTINNTFKKYYGKPIKLVITKHKYHCLDCNKYFRDEVPVVQKMHRISNGVVEEIKEDLKEIQSFKKISDSHDVSVTEVIRIFDNLPGLYRHALRIAICIDEFCFKVTNTNKYPVVISDSKSGTILDIVESRKLEYLKDYLNNKNLIEIQTVKYVCTDMHETFRKIVKIYFKKAIHIVDFFHVSKQFTSLVNEKRCAAMGCFEKNTATYNFYKKHWEAFLVNPNELDIKYENGIRWKGYTYQASEIVFAFAKKSQTLLEAYLLYKDFCTYMNEEKYSDVGTIEKNLSFLIYKANQNTDKDIRKLGDTLLNWSEEIINAYSIRNDLMLSNATAEGNNNRIKKIIGVSYGYVDFYRMRKRVLYIQHFHRKKREI